jgi:hypothetical protein
MPLAVKVVTLMLTNINGRMLLLGLSRRSTDNSKKQIFAYNYLPLNGLATDVNDNKIIYEYK